MIRGISATRVRSDCHAFKMLINAGDVDIEGSKATEVKCGYYNRWWKEEESTTPPSWQTSGLPPPLTHTDQEKYLLEGIPSIFSTTNPDKYTIEDRKKARRVWRRRTTKAAKQASDPKAARSRAADRARAQAQDLSTLSIADNDTDIFLIRTAN